jgi:PAS domain S-box-containing protein
MSSMHLLWIGELDAEIRGLQGTLEAQLDGLTVTTVYDAHEALTLLSHNPSRHLIVVVDARTARLEVGEIVNSVKQINPAIELIVLCDTRLSWTTLNLPRYYRPILIMPPLNKDVLTSSVAKLREMVEAKEDHAYLNRVIKTRVTTSRMDIEKLLVALHGQAGTGLIRIRRDGFFISYNLEAQRLTGYPPREITHVQTWAQELLGASDEAGSLLRALEDLWAGHSDSRDLHLPISREEGIVVKLSARLIGIHDETGQTLQVAVVLYDPMEKSAVEEYKVLMQNGPSSFYTYVPDGSGFLRLSHSTLDVINRAFSLNLTALDVVGHRLDELPLPSKMASTWQEYLAVAVENQSSRQDSFVPLGLPGKRILKHTFIAPVPIGPGEQKTVLGQIEPQEELWSHHFSDVHPDILAEQCLEKLPEAFILVRAERYDTGLIRRLMPLKANKRAESLLGLKQSRKWETPLGDLLPEERTAKKLSERVRNVIESGEDDQFELWLQVGSRDAEHLLIRFWVGKVGDGAGIFLRDVTSIREEERELREYRQVFAHMQEAAIVADVAGKIVNWNPASEGMFGYTKDEILGKSASVFTRPGKDPQKQHRYDQDQQDEPLRQIETGFVRKDGSRGVASTLIASVRDDIGNARGSVSLYRDVTERKRREERLSLRINDLEEKNFIMSTLLRQAEAERVRAREDLAKDLARRVTGALQRISEVKDRADLVESLSRQLLDDLRGEVSPGNLDSAHPIRSLTDKEMEVARLIRMGKTTEEISFILGKSPDTVRLQRISIRKKLGLDRRDRNLASYIKRMDL